MYHVIYRGSYIVEFKKSSSRKRSRQPHDSDSHSVQTPKQSGTRSPTHRLKALCSFFSTKKTITTLVSLLAVAVIGTTYWLYTSRASNEHHQGKIIESLEYQTVTPRGKSIQQLGGWRRVSPPKSTPVYAYIDSIDGIQISVSQQPLPDKFIEETDSKLDELAKGFGATNEISADGIKVYVGTSAKGPQSALFIKNGLLILVKSQHKIATTSWKSYAESLK